MAEIIDIEEDGSIEPEVFPEIKKGMVKHKREWKVMLDNELLDTVYYAADLNSNQVRGRLIKVDGYPTEIEVID